MITLRPYQDDLVARIRAAFQSGHRRVLAVAPTGSGKTVIFSHLAARVHAKGKRITVLVHRDELVDQVSETLTQFDVPHAILAAGRPRHHQSVVVASVFTLARRLGQYPDPDLLIIDEAHHALQASTWGRVMQHYGRALVLGVTATPQRLSGEGLCQSFDTMEVGPTVRELIDLGALCDYRAFAPATIDVEGLRRRGGDFNRGELAQRADKASITGDAVSHYRRLADGLPAVAFCVSVEHAQHVAAQFRAAGYRAASIDGGMERDVRRGVVADFRDGRLNVLTSADLISEGFDMPNIHVGILLRPTASLALCLQQIGRTLRPAPGKERAILLDHAGNLYKHGLPDDVHEWTLAGGVSAKRGADDKTPSVKVCPKCFAAVRAFLSSCSECGVAFVVKGRTVDEREGELVELDPELVRRNRKQEQGRAGTLDELIALGVQRQYKNPVKWATMIFTHRQARGR